MNVQMNKSGYDNIDLVMKRGNTPLSVKAFEAAANETGAVMLDTRNAQVFSEGFIPNSINIGVDGQFAPWVGAMLPDVNQPLLLIAENGKQEEVLKRLARVGYDNVLGFLDGGFEKWKANGGEVDCVKRITADAFASELSDATIVVDVRKPGEFEAEHVKGAINIPLDFINEQMASFPKDKPFVMHCAGGYRSMIAASILKSRGYDQFREVAGGFGAISKTEVPKTNFKCSSSK
jgi:rhodanese-related sulfurtransferase